METQHLLEKCWCKRSVATNNLNSNEIFTLGIPQKTERRCWERASQIYIYSYGTFSPFHTLVKLVDAVDITNGKFNTLDLRLKLNEVTSNLEFQISFSETYDSDPEIRCTQTIDSNNKSKPQFRKLIKKCHIPNHSVSNCFRRQRKDEEKEKKRKFF